MKKIISLLCLIFSAIILVSCSVNGDVVDEKEKTDVTTAESTADTTASDTEAEYRAEDIVSKDKVIGKAYYDGEDVKYKEFYDADGNVSSVKNYENGEIVSVDKIDSAGIVREKYENGVIVENESLDKDGNVKCTEKYQYDEGGNIVGSEAKTPDGKLVSRTEIEYQFGRRAAIYTYDANGNLIHTAHYDADGNLTIDE